MNQKEIKKENRKALKWLILVMVLCGLAGGIIGFFSAFIEESDLAVNIVDITKQLLQTISPWGILLVIVVLQIPSFIYLRKAGRKFKELDEDDEEAYEIIDKDIQKAMLFANVSTPFNIFFLSCTAIDHTMIVVTEFLISVILALIVQQKSVDFIRMMNPEKKGSVYDFKFQKKWLDSCDEAEHKKIGEASYKAYTVTQISCLVLWLILLVADKMFHTGVLPIFVVLLIFTISMLSYMIESMK